MPFSISVVGAGGRMGAMLRGVWRAKHRVFGLDRRPDAAGALALRSGDLAAAIPRSDLVVLCVPAPAMEETLGRLAPFLRQGQILADVCSVKVNPMRWMESVHAGPVVGTHPLFGPENDRAGARVALVPGRKAAGEDVARLEGLFRGLGCLPFLTTAEEHDRACSLSQSLHFVLAAAYFAAASREDVEPYITPSFMRHVEASKNELTRNAAMFCEFTRANPLFPGVLKEFTGLLAESGGEALDSLVARAARWYR